MVETETTQEFTRDGKLSERLRLQTLTYVTSRMRQELYLSLTSLLIAEEAHRQSNQ